MNARLKRKFKNNSSQIFELNRSNKFIKDVYNTLNKLQNECYIRYFRHFTLNLRS